MRLKIGRGRLPGAFRPDLNCHLSGSYINTRREREKLLHREAPLGKTLPKTSYRLSTYMKFYEPKIFNFFSPSNYETADGDKFGLSVKLLLTMRPIVTNLTHVTPQVNSPI